MKDREGFPNPMDIEPERDSRRSREAGEWEDSRYRDDWRRDRQTYDDYEASPRRAPRRSHAPRFGRFGTGGPYSGYSGFGGPGWTPGGYGDPGYNTSGFGSPDYGQSRTGGSDRWDTAATQRWESGSFEHRGPYSGRGPKGYTRSDDRIREDLCERLTMSGYCDASEVEVDVQNGEAVLTGTVRDRQQKYAAEEIAERIAGVRTVDNRIRVVRD